MTVVQVHGTIFFFVVWVFPPDLLNSVFVTIATVYSLIGVSLYLSAVYSSS